MELENKKIDDLLLKVIYISPIAMLFQRIFDPINRIVLGLLILMLLFKASSKLSQKNVLILFTSVVLFVISLFNINPQYINANMYCYYPLYFLFIIYIAENFESIYRLVYSQQKLIKQIILVWCFMVMISAVIPSSYDTSGKFMSFSNGTFRFAPTALFITVLIWVYCGITHNRKFALTLIVPFVATTFTGCRTYTIIQLIFILYVYYNYCRKKSSFFLTVLPISFFVYLFLQNTYFFRKFLEAESNPYAHNFWNAISSGRTTFWSGEIKIFLKSSVFQEIFGGGLTASFVRNVDATGQAIWAHNDFLDMLNCHGSIGLFLYIFVFILAFKAARKMITIPLYKSIGFIIICAANAFFNGLYVYPTALLSVPFLYIALSFDFKFMQKPISENRVCLEGGECN